MGLYLVAVFTFWDRMGVWLLLYRIDVLIFHTFCQLLFMSSALCCCVFIHVCEKHKISIPEAISFLFYSYLFYTVNI